MAKAINTLKRSTLLKKIREAGLQLTQRNVPDTKLVAVLEMLQVNPNLSTVCNQHPFIELQEYKRREIEVNNLPKHARLTARGVIQLRLHSGRWVEASVSASKHFDNQIERYLLVDALQEKDVYLRQVGIFLSVLREAYIMRAKQGKSVKAVVAEFPDVFCPSVTIDKNGMSNMTAQIIKDLARVHRAEKARRASLRRPSVSVREESYIVNAGMRKVAPRKRNTYKKQPPPTTASKTLCFNLDLRPDHDFQTSSEQSWEKELN